MALRKVRIMGDSILTKKSKPVMEMNEKIRTLVEDMFETMYASNGVGLAAPQIGILKRVVVIDCGDNPLVLINPEIVDRKGIQRGEEGCLSVPGKCGIVTRPESVTFRAYDINMQPYEMCVEQLEARAVCHELDHLDGKLYVEQVEGELVDVEQEEGE